jgi:alpha-1,6-mannosyltransferase
MAACSGWAITLMWSFPAGAELFFRAITAIHESVFTLKVAFVVCDLAIVLVLLDVLRRSGQAAHWVLAYAWNPLLATEVAGSGHIDIVGVLLLMVSVAALARRWRAVAAVAFGLAVAVKLLPIVLLPLYWKRVRIRDGALAAVVAGLLYVPFLNHGRIPIGSLGTYAHSFRFNDPVFATLERVAAPELVVGLAVLAGFLIAVWLRGKSAAWSSEVFAWPMTASLFCSPAVSAIGLDAADHHMDGEHYPNLLCLAFACPWPSVDSSWVDHAAGIRMRGNGRCHYRISQVQTARGTRSLAK